MTECKYYTVTTVIIIRWWLLSNHCTTSLLQTLSESAAEVTELREKVGSVDGWDTKTRENVLMYVKNLVTIASNNITDLHARLTQLEDNQVLPDERRMRRTYERC